MKAKIIIVSVALIASVNVYFSSAKKIDSDILLKNIEALATGENTQIANYYNMYLQTVTSSCKICKYQENSWCNVHTQLPDCY